MHRHSAWIILLGTWLAAVSARGDGVGPPIRDPRYVFQARVWSWKAIQECNIVMQKRDYSCGAAALATVLRYYWGDNVGETAIVKVIMRNLSAGEFADRVKNGLSMTDLRKAAVAGGYVASMGRISLDAIAQLRAPVIVRLKQDEYEHFVVLRGMLEDRVFLADPIRGNIRMYVCEFSRQWPDRAVLVVVKPGVPLPACSPLLVVPHCPVRPELQIVRRALAVRP